MRIVRTIIMFLLGSTLLCMHAPAGPLRIALLSDTSIQSDTILLAHLLPPSVPLEIRQRAERISIGNAPELGSARRLARGVIEGSLRAGAFLPEEFLVPESVIVHRTSRLFSREEVARALQAALSANGKITLVDFHPEAVELQAAISVPSDDARLAVTEMSFDKLAGRTRFRLRASATPKTPQFYAWYSPENTLSLEVNPNLPASVFHSATRAANPVATLVEPRRLARLYLHSPNMSTVLRVRPLQSGQSGETVRVRLPGNGRTLLAKVIGLDSLEAAFQEKEW